MKDDELSEQLTSQILDMYNVAINPAEKYWQKPSRKTTIKQITLQPTDCQYSDYSEEETRLIEQDAVSNILSHVVAECVTDYDDAHNERDEEKQDIEYKQEADDGKHEDKRVAGDDDEYSEDWVIVARGWDDVTAWINNSHLKEIFNNHYQDEDDQQARKEFVKYIGNRFRVNLGEQYLRRLHLDDIDFKLLQNKTNEWVFLFQNMRSKWRSSNKYNVVLNFWQIYLWQKSMGIYFDSALNDLPHDEQHWLLWLQADDHSIPVSTFLHTKYIEEHKELVRKAAARYKKKNTLYHGVDLKKAPVKELKELAQDLKIPVTGLRKADIQNKLKEHKESTSKGKKSTKKQKQTKQKTNQYDNNDMTKEEVTAYAKTHGIYQLINNNSTKKFNFITTNKPAMKRYCEKNKLSSDGTKLVLMRTIIKHHQQSTNTESVDDNHNHNVANTDNDDDDIDTVDEDGDTAAFYQSAKPHDLCPELQYLDRYPVKEKSWFDLNFQLFESDLARLQHRCECFAGAQLPGPCAHICCSLWLVYYSLFDEIADFLKPTKREEQIRLNVNDLTYWTEYRKKSTWHCPLCRSNTNDSDLIECDCCKAWYHPQCINTSMKEITKDGKVLAIWHCPFCDSNQVWMVRTT